ncbi:MAG: DUF4912 domain-containing protein [Acidobacteria bacterium]|nr:DUF4912 domain-containing protein [Acidobacteriota bacterium]
MTRRAAPAAPAEAPAPPPRRARAAESRKPTTAAPRKVAPATRPLEPAPLELETEDPRLRRAGQVASERARFDLGPHGKVIGEGLGTLPPGYDLTFVRGLIRDPNHLVAVWDINDEVAIAAAESIGWDRVGLRVLDESGRVLVQELVGGRGGTYHIRVGRPGRTVRVAVGIDRPDGFFLTLARSAPVRMPADAPAGTFEPYQEIRIPARLDRRLLLRSEPPARPGQRGPRRTAPAARLHERLLLALRVLPGDFWISKDHELWRAFALSEAARESAAEDWPEAFHEAGAAGDAGPRGGAPGAPGESITSPAGWSASGPVEEAPTSPGAAGRWLSGAGPDGR